MKKVIRGRVYDTDGAKCVGEWDNGYFTNDFHYCAETLYQKKTGEFFLYGEGHALSKYASHSGNSSGWGDKFIPLTYEEAQAWVEEHLEGDEYISIFGVPEESGEKSQMHISISDTVISKAKQRAAKEGISISALFEKAVEKYLAE